jgi:hypothetical protein
VRDQRVFVLFVLGWVYEYGERIAVVPLSIRWQMSHRCFACHPSDTHQRKIERDANGRLWLSPLAHPAPAEAVQHTPTPAHTSTPLSATI